MHTRPLRPKKRKGGSTVTFARTLFSASKRGLCIRNMGNRESRPTHHHADVQLGTHEAVLEHETRFHGAPRTVRMGGAAQVPVYLQLGAYADTLAGANRKNTPERNDTFYFAQGALIMNTLQLALAFVMPAYGLAAICIVAYAFYALALLPYVLQHYAPTSVGAPLHGYLLALLSYAGLALLGAYMAYLVVWLAWAGVFWGWRLRVAYALVQAVTALMAFGLLVALVNMRHAYVAFVACHTTAATLKRTANEPTQAHALSDAGLRVAAAAHAKQ